MLLILLIGKIIIVFIFQLVSTKNVINFKYEKKMDEEKKTCFQTGVLVYQNFPILFNIL